MHALSRIVSVTILQHISVFEAYSYCLLKNIPCKESKVEHGWTWPSAVWPWTSFFGTHAVQSSTARTASLSLDIKRTLNGVYKAHLNISVYTVHVAHNRT